MLRKVIVMSLFLYREGIKGEASDKNFKDWIDIIELSFGISRKITSSTSTQGDRESSNATIGDLKFLRFMDKASPKLFLEACCGKGSTVKIVQTKTGTGDGAHVFLEYTLDNAVISSLHVEATNDSGYRPVEQLTISFTKLTTKYISYDEDGNQEAPIVVGFDTATNTKV